MERRSKGWMYWAGWALAAPPSLVLLVTGVLKVMRYPNVLQQMVGTFGYPDGAVVVIGAVELLCLAIYVAPRTAILGAGLIASYFGGAVATRVRAGEVGVLPILLGVLAWAGLFLRDERLRALCPLRRPATTTTAPRA